MSKTRTLFYCRECGAESLRWEGRCPACGEWNALTEAPAPDPGRHGTRFRPAGENRPRLLGEASAERPHRLEVGFGEVDRVLGGGLVPGSVLLLGGAPGIGKSTLLLQIGARLCEAGETVLYVSGEESQDQVRLRADRLSGGAAEVLFLASAHVAEILDAAHSASPTFLCVDSIQTLSSERIPGAPGNLGQVRECAGLLHEYAKRSGAALALVGHITKGGLLAGPRTLEHVVDVVLHFEGQRSGEHRLLRSTKNRFGSVEEVAVFRMTPTGLSPVGDPSSLFLSQPHDGVSGTAVAIPVHGTRPLPAEVQALSAKARFSSPQRVSTGFPARRLALLLAVLERRAGVRLGDADVFLNVVGGLRLADPAADLAVVAALASSERDRPVPSGTAFVGEVGLGGEVRGVSRADARVREALRAGLTRIVLPAVLSEDLGATPGALFVRHVRDVVTDLEER